MIYAVNARARKLLPGSWLITKWEGVPYHHTALMVNGFVYETVLKGTRKTPISEWLIHYKVTHFQDVESFLDLNAEDIEDIKSIGEQFLTDDVPYGFMTIVGIMLFDLLKLKWFRDGRKSLICSETLYRLLENHLPKVENPDYLSPTDMLEMLEMREAGANLPL